MTYPINQNKPIIDKKFIIEQAENNNIIVWEFLKGFADIEHDTLRLDQLDYSGLYPVIKNTYKERLITMTDKKYIKHIISESSAIKSENQKLKAENQKLKAENEKLKDEIELQDQTIDLLNQTAFKLRSKIQHQENEIYVLNDTLSTLRFHIEKLKEKYSQ